MDIFRYCIYGFWIIIPVGFFTLSLWNAIESRGKEQSALKRQATDLYNQGVFVGIFTVLCFVFDFFIFEPVLKDSLPLEIPPNFARLLLFPIALFLGSIFIGGSEPIKIKKAPSPTRRRGKK